jgi:hypothetical protein
MAIKDTDWRERLTPLDILVNIDGEEQPVPWLYGTTSPVFVDVSEQLDTDELVTNLVVTLRRLPTAGEADYSTADDKIAGAADIAGSMISQRLQNLERGRVYRMELLFGPSDNRRGASILVQCTE